MALDVVALGAAKKYTDKKIEGIESEGIGETTRENIEANTAARHTHNNYNVLEKIGINKQNTRPTFVIDWLNGTTDSLATLTDVTSRYAEINSKLYNNYYEKTEIDRLVSIIPKFSIEVVDTLPTENISNTTIYLVRESETEKNLYTEYIYINNTWEALGTQTLDLTNYLKKDEFNFKWSPIGERFMVGDIQLAYRSDLISYLRKDGENLLNEIKTHYTDYPLLGDVLNQLFSNSISDIKFEDGKLNFYGVDSFYGERIILYSVELPSLPLWTGGAY